MIYTQSIILPDNQTQGSFLMLRGMQKKNQKYLID